ncbi:MAG: hypothetical protein JW932_11500 [Deltaproteobacteria bacterium]|nr:hypothetical protein [Deltaproteobacteria bacterium]
MHRKDCFGILEKVFPVGAGGLRETPSACFQCPERVKCLKEALATREGIEMLEKILDRTATSGFVSRLSRWSKKKTLDRRKKEIRGKKGKRW